METKPWIGIALFSLAMYEASSLKDRRQVVRSLTERAKRHYNVSVADLGPDGRWDRADIAVSGVGSSLYEVEQRMAGVQDFMEKMEADGEFEIVSAHQEVFSYGDV